MTIGMNSEVVRNNMMISTPMDSDVIILNMAKNNYTGLNDIGRVIWDMLEKPCRVDDLCCRLSVDFKETPEHIAEDVIPFLEELESDTLIKVVGETDRYHGLTMEELQFQFQLF